MATLNHPHEPREIGNLTIGGRALTCAFQDATWSSETTGVDVSGVCREGDLTQITGMQGKLAGDFFGASSNGFVTNHLDFTALTVAGVDILPQTYTLNFSGTFGKANLPGATLGMAAGVLRKNYTGSLEMVLDDNATVQALVVAAESMTVANHEVALSFTLNGTAITLPIQLQSVSHPITVGDYQKVTIGFTSQAPARGTAFPTAPTTLPGTPGLLDWAILSPRTPLAFTFDSNTVQFLRRTGFLAFDGFNFSRTDRGITLFHYDFVTVGNYSTVILAS